MKIAILTAGTRDKRQQGFTYLMVLVAVVVVGILAGAASTMNSYRVRATDEAELLFRGLAYQRAIKSYYLASRGVKTYPRTLEDLLQDPRYASKRHLRALYPDPMREDNSDGDGWILIRTSGGGIVGVSSSGSGVPLKQSGFAPGLEAFEQAESYRDWIFEYRPAAKKAANSQ